MAFPPRTRNVALGSAVIDTSGTSWKKLSPLPGARPSFSNSCLRKAIVFSSPGDDGPRPSNSSDDSIRMSAWRSSATIVPSAASRAGSPPHPPAAMSINPRPSNACIDCRTLVMSTFPVLPTLIHPATAFYFPNSSKLAAASRVCSAIRPTASATTAAYPRRLVPPPNVVLRLTTRRKPRSSTNTTP